MKDPWNVRGWQEAADDQRREANRRAGEAFAKRKEMVQRAQAVRAIFARVGRATGRRV